MNVYKFIVDAERERFMESPLRETTERYVSADTYDQAHSYVWERLEKAGWKVKKITGEKIILENAKDTNGRKHFRRLA